MARFLLLTLIVLFSWVVSQEEKGSGIGAEELPLQHINAVSKPSSNEDLHNLMTNETDWEIFPESDLGSRFFNNTRRTLGSFQVCALCTCCGGRRRFCIPTACCYTITCGSPNRPFGLCSFRPMSCNCLSCRL
ncbi:hypothetical protein L7F22_047416 [Adiantum nelumboides]|nr:hypothetical protein [Adiantum nelumboides]